MDASDNRFYREPGRAGELSELAHQLESADWGDAPGPMRVLALKVCRAIHAFAPSATGAASLDAIETAYEAAREESVQAGAAEPDAVRALPKGQMSAVALANIIDPLAFQNAVGDASKTHRQAEALKKAMHIRALYASPKDVGREATIETFAKSLEVRAAGYAARGDSIFTGRIIAEELNEQARRLRLSHNGGGRG